MTGRGWTWRLILAILVLVALIAYLAQGGRLW